MMEMIKNLEFKRVHNEFQSILNNEIREMYRSNNLFMSADKSRDIHRINKTRYEQFMHDNVTKTYKKCNNDKTKTINIKAKKIASKLKLEDRIQILDDNDATFLLKTIRKHFQIKFHAALLTHPKLT